MQGAGTAAIPSHALALPPTPSFFLLLFHHHQGSPSAAAALPAPETPLRVSHPLRCAPSCCAERCRPCSPLSAQAFFFAHLCPLLRIPALSFSHLACLAALSPSSLLCCAPIGVQRTLTPPQPPQQTHSRMLHHMLHPNAIRVTHTSHPIRLTPSAMHLLSSPTIALPLTHPSSSFVQPASMCSQPQRIPGRSEEAPLSIYYLVM